MIELTGIFVAWTMIPMIPLTYQYIYIYYVASKLRAVRIAEEPTELSDQPVVEFLNMVSNQSLSTMYKVR